MKNSIYPFSVFYLTKSVFDEVGKGNKKAIELIFKTILMNIRFKDKIGTNITFTTEDVFDRVREEQYIEKFKGFMALGKNIAFPEPCENIHGDSNFKIVQSAINKDGDVLGIVKIVVEESVAKEAIQKIVDDDAYPLGVVSCEQCLEELQVIELRLKEMFGA